MKHYVYGMDGETLDSANLGDIKSWFIHSLHKWKTDDCISVERHVFPDIKQGDELWFVIGDRTIGYVKVLRVSTDDRKEIYFCMNECISPKSNMTVGEMMDFWKSLSLSSEKHIIVLFWDYSRRYTLYSN